MQSLHVIPSNIVEGVSTQAAADNADFNINNLDGKDSVHITSVVLYQEKTQLISGHFRRNFDAERMKRRRSTNLGERKILTYKPSLARIEPGLEGEISSALISQLANYQSPSKLINWSWLYCRIASVKHSEVNIVSNNEVQCIPQRTGFNALISFVPSNPSSIGYAPFIPAPPN